MSSNKRFGSLSFWAWNDKMNEQEIILQIEDFKKKGFIGFFMHSRAGLDIPYLGSEWFDACKVAVNKAKELNLEAWVYDEDGWPSGFAGGKVTALGVDYQVKRLRYSNKIEEEHRNHVIAYYKELPSGEFQVTNQQDYTLCFYYIVDPHYVDLLSEKVTEKFIEITHEKYKRELGEHFGTVIKGFFTDEPQLNFGGLPYSFELTKVFQERNGYELIECLPYLQCKLEKAHSYRYDFWSTISDMIVKNYTKKLYDWCQNNGLILTGHMPGEDSLIHQITSCGGVMSHYKYMHAPGIDHLGRRIASIVLEKQVTSIAKQLGKEMILSETFGCAGWNITFEQLCWIWGWQASFGINTLALHISAYSIKGIRKRDYPAFYSYQEPWWDQFAVLNQWMSNLSNTIASFDYIDNILVIHPISTFQGLVSDDIGVEQQRLSCQYRLLLENLMDAQIDFDIGDENTIIENGRVINNKLIVGNCTYNMVIVPECISLKGDLCTLLDEFIKKSGALFAVNSPPRYIDYGPKEMTKSLQNVKVIQNRSELFCKYFDSIGHERIVTILDSTGFYVAKNFSITVKQSDEALLLYVWNKNQSDNRNTIIKAIGHKNIYSLNIQTGTRIPLETFHDDHYTYAKHIFFGYASELFVITEASDEIMKTSYLISKEYPSCSISLSDLNVLTIDYARYSLNGHEYSDEKPVILLHNDIYNNDDLNTVYVKYTFFVNDSYEGDLSLCAETSNCISAKVNQSEILNNRKGWFIDKEIHEFDITDQTFKGFNEVVLQYTIPITKKSIDENEVFETERNRFFFPVEPEAIYIRGKFDTFINGNVSKKPTCISIRDASFAIGNPTEKKGFGDLTHQGLWFYRGDILYTLSLNKKEDQSIVVTIIEPKCALVCIEVFDNETCVSLYASPYKADITTLLKTGDNKIRIKAFGTNRNILGPHHHVKGENNFVGVHTL